MTSKMMYTTMMYTTMMKTTMTMNHSNSRSTDRLVYHWSWSTYSWCRSTYWSWSTDSFVYNWGRSTYNWGWSTYWSGSTYNWGWSTDHLSTLSKSLFNTSVRDADDLARTGDLLNSLTWD